MNCIRIFSRPKPALRIRHVSALLCGLLLALAALVFPSIAQASSAGDELILNGSLHMSSGEAVPEGWKWRGGSNHARVILPVMDTAGNAGAGGVFEFSGQNAGAQQVVPLSPDWWKLEFRFRMKTQDVVQGKSDWQNARMALRFIDGNWQTVTPWPKSIGRLGTQDWTEYAVTLKIPEGAKSLVVEPAMFGDSGTVWFADISLRILSGRPVRGDAVSPFGKDVDPWDWKDAWKAQSATRERVSLNGYWRFFPIFDKPVADGATADRVPLPGSGWGFFKVPGFWNPENRNEQPVILSPWIENNLEEAKVSPGAFSTAWYQRRIDVPKSWTGRRVVLRLEDVQGTANVLVDGHPAGVIGWPGGELDLTRQCAPGQSHELTLLVSDRVPADNPLAPPAYRDSLAKGDQPVMRNRGLCGDAWLDAMPDPAQSGLRLGPILIQTSVRKGQISFRTPFVMEPGRASPLTLSNLLLRAEIFDADGRKVKTIESRPGALAGAKPDAEAPREHERVLTWGGEWTPGTDGGPALWELENPRLYTARIALVRRDGTLVDETLPVRFGFREFWIEGRDMLLNGHRITLRALQVRNNMHPSSYMAGMEACRDTIANIKNVGGNFATTHNYQVNPGQTGYGGNLYTAADEMGLMLSFTLPHERSYDWELDKPDVRAAYARLTRWLIEQHGNHPSIVLYATSHNSIYNLDMNPLKVNDAETTAKEGAAYMDQTDSKNLAGRRWQAFNIVEPVVHELDPSRVIYHHSGGNAGAMITQNDYPNWSPPQERAEFHALWAEKGTKPLFLIEYGLPHTASFTSYRGPHFIYSSAAALDPKWWLDSEYAAAFFNQAAYEMSSAKADAQRTHLQTLQSGKPAGWGKFKSDVGYYDVLALHMRHYLPAFRTLGISTQLWDMEELWERDTGADRQWHPGDRERGASVADVSSPGMRPDFHSLAWQRVYDRPGTSFWVETSATREMRRWNQPVIGFIGGGDPGVAGFTGRAHNFEPGRTAHKQLIVVNDRARDVRCDYEWSLEGTGAAGKGALTVQAGGQSRLPIEIALPPTLSAGSYRLTARFTFDASQTQTDAFTIDVLDPVPNGRTGPVVLFDPVGDSSRTLTRLGIAHRRYTNATGLPSADALLREGAVLAIGRGALDSGVKLPQLRAVTLGLNVLVFEQTQDALRKIGGFRTQILRVRNVFVRAPGHPALRGLSNALLADWQGDSSLIDKFANARDLSRDQPGELWCGFRDARVWQTSNRGAVATVLIEKPPVGDFLPLVDAGFDLQYSPLIEWRPASRESRSGRMILCQLDVTERSRPDPAADRLVRNLVDTLQNHQAARVRRLIYAGDKKGGDLLASLGFVAESYDGSRVPDAGSVLVLGPGAPVVRDIDAKVREGLHVFALGLSRDELARQWPERFAGIEERELVPSLMDADALAAPEFAGISNAETHWWAFPRLAVLPSSPDAKGNEALQCVEAGRGLIVFSQGAPWLFADNNKPWERTTWRRSVWLVSRLLHNLGAVDQNTGALEALLASGNAGRPRPWLQTHYLQIPVQSDDPYIYYRW